MSAFAERFGGHAVAANAKSRLIRREIPQWGCTHVAGAREGRRRSRMVADLHRGWSSTGSGARPALGRSRRRHMSTFTTKDGTGIFYKDWGAGQPVVFSHGWPLSADAWDPQMVFLGERGYRVVAHDRRGHGRSEQTWDGNDMDTYADDLAELFEALDLKQAVLVGHSTGGGEVARYVGRHGTARVAK